MVIVLDALFAFVLETKPLFDHFEKLCETVGILITRRTQTIHEFPKIKDILIKLNRKLIFFTIF